MLPGMTTQGRVSYIDALFTSTSAVCVTGLVVNDTGSNFTRLGQWVLLVLIQLGGLGIMTFSTVFLLILGTASVLGVAAVALILFGAFLFLIYPAFQSFVAKKVPDRNQVLAFSIVANIQMITGSIVVLISGFLSDRFGINSPFLFLVGLGILVLANYILKKDSPLFARRHS